jgi:hypothetical protein
MKLMKVPVILKMCLLRALVSESYLSGNGLLQIFSVLKN